MNIAIIIQSLTGGGAERVAKLVGDNYVEKGHNVYYILTNDKVKNVYAVNGKVLTISCDYNDSSYSRTIRDAVKYSRRIRKIKRKLKIDVAISFMEWCNLLNVLSKGKEKTITSVRTALSVRNELKGLIYEKRTIKLVSVLSDLMIIPSEWQKNDLVEEYGISRKKLVVIPNPAAVRPVISNDKWEYGNKVIACVGRLDPVKQQDRIIRAFSYAYEKDKDAKLLVLGEGKTYDYLKMICKKQGVENSVFFIGFTTDIGYYLKNIRALVMASKAEGFPNAIVEAMAYGVPIITTDSPGGCGEIVGKKEEKNSTQYCNYGILVPYIRGKAPKAPQLEPNEKMLGEAILEILSNQDSYLNYSRQSKIRSDFYNPDMIMEKWNNILFYWEDK